MEPSIYSDRSRIFCEHLKKLRIQNGMTQRDLAAALGREHGMVARIELGERRVDFVEAYDIFKALKTSPNQEAASIMEKFESVSSPDSSNG